MKDLHMPKTAPETSAAEHADCILKAISAGDSLRLRSALSRAARDCKRNDAVRSADSESFETLDAAVRVIQKSGAEGNIARTVAIELLTHLVNWGSAMASLNRPPVTAPDFQFEECAAPHR
jgi:hypothetical protein